jgi:outer membrane immunogenic protein
MHPSKCAIVIATILPVAASGAWAADLGPAPRRQPAPAPIPVEEPYAPALRWSGLYAGLSAGAAFSEDSGFAGAGSLGYNWATPYNVVYGVEGDIGFMDVSDGSRKVGPFWSTLRGRVGYATGMLLPYLTYGVAFAEADNGVGRDNDIQTGWVAGGGAEMAISDKTSVKLEYLHMDFDQSNNRAFSFDGKVDLVRVGLNMRF